MPSTSLSRFPGILLRRAGAWLGWLSLFATLALLSPGVRAIARADALAGEPGPSCQANSGDRTAAELARVIERLRAQAELQGADQGGVVVLNNRGYHYAAEPAASLPEGERER